MRVPLKYSLVAALSAACTISSAQPAAKAPTVWGAGSTPCAKFVEAYENNQAAPAVNMVGSWVQGYVSAWNVRLQSYGGTTLRFVEPEVITLFVYRYCQDNQKKRVDAAALALIDDLAKPDKAE